MVAFLRPSDEQSEPSASLYNDPLNTDPQAPAAAPLIAIAGPTGSGKSELALRAAAEFQGEVVNCDSVQVYRGFDIGTAKLRASDRRGIPHHLIDIAGPEEIFTAGEFARRGREALAEIAARGRVPIITGGTGFYLRALLDGLSPGPARNPAIRERLTGLERRRPGSLHRLLHRLDAAAAGKIHPNDLPKTMRALEIRLLTGAPSAVLFQTGKPRLQGFRVLKVGLFPDRAALYERLDRRCERMFEEGLLDEARLLLARGVPRGAKPFQSLGYRQALQVLQGELTLTEAIDAAKQETRRYAKRQMTWFRQERDLARFEGFGEEEAIQSAIVKLAGSVIWPF